MAADPGFFGNLLTNFNGLLAGESKMSPLFNFGTGLLAASGPTEAPTSFGQRLASGLQFAGNAQKQSMLNQLLRERIVQGQAERAERERRQKALEELGGLLSGDTLTPQQGDADDLTATTVAPDQKKVMGLLAQVAPEQFARGLLAQMAPQEPTTLERDYRFLVGIGVPPERALEALKKGTTVNVGDAKLDQPVSASDALKIRMPDGSAPPLGATTRQIAAAGGVVMTDAQQKAMDAADKFGGILDKLENLALGEKNPKTGQREGGVFTGIEPGLGNRVDAGLKLFIGSLNRDRPNIEAYRSLAEGTIAPFVRQLGESGALANEDVARALGLLPQIQGDFLLPDTQEDAINKLGSLRAILEKGMGNLRKQGPEKATPARKKSVVIDFNELP